VGQLPATNHLYLAIILPQRNQDALGKLAQQIYDPASPNFHRYLTPAQFNERFGPADADYQAVIGFAKAHGLTVTHTVPGRTIVGVDAAVADIEKALHVTLLLYQHPTEPRQFFAPDVEPSLDLEVPIQVISGLNNYVIPHHKRLSRKIAPMATPNANSDYSIPPYCCCPCQGDVCGSYIPGTGSFTNAIGIDPCFGNWFMGSDFRNAFVPGTPLTGTGQVVGLYECDGYTPADITEYEAVAGLPNVPVQYVSVNGAPNNPDNNDGETPLDIDMAIAMAPGLSEVVFYRGDDNHPDDIFTEMADPTQGEPLPLQLSCSWGYTVDTKTYTIFARFAVQGQSYCGESGDGGARNLGTTESAAAPYQTVVGGTELAMYGLGASWSNETVWGDSGTGGSGGAGGSGGGFIPGIPIPAYQQPMTNIMTAVGGSTVWRNFPDVAMPADNILVFITDTNGVQWAQNMSGTSCAAPLWAGFTALVNQQAEALKQGPVGFLNPAIYAIGQGPNYSNCFHDITVGNNTWSNSPTLYYAYPGYDLCTGWGSPNGTNLINMLTSLNATNSITAWTTNSGVVWVDFNYTGSSQNGSYNAPFTNMAQAISVVTPIGVIWIKSAGSSPATMTITKPMTIRAYNGAATVGD
jgi:kumamolisin